MRLYLDTADRTAAESLLDTGLFAGLTTNPTILRRSGLGVKDTADVYRWATAAGAQEVFFQAWGETVDVLFERGMELRALGEEVVVKLPASRAGATACARLADEDVPTLLTAVYSAGQAMIADAAGATYIAPYLGRLNDAGRDGFAEVLAMQELLDATGSQTEILLASIRDVPAMVTLARQGVPNFTFGVGVAEAFFTDAMTAAAVQVFEQDVAESGER